MPSRSARRRLRISVLAAAGLALVACAERGGGHIPTVTPLTHSTPTNLDLSTSDPYAATVAGVPPADLADLPEFDVGRDLWRYTLPSLPGREVPRIFWYYRDGLGVGFAPQPHPAPLAFLIAGTGASATSSTTLLLARVLLKAGRHVLLLPSPTYARFIVTSSSTAVPGYQPQDARDLYRVMELARDAVAQRFMITGYDLVGFSLGGMNAAYVAKLDADEHKFDFAKVLLVNPPYDLETSLDRVDELLDQFTRRNPDAVRDFIDEAFAALAVVYRERPGTELTGEDFYRTVYLLQDRPDLLKQLIGLSFRVSASAIAFTSDVMTHAGYLIAADAQPGITTSLTSVFQASMRLSFQNFLDELAVPHFLAEHPGIDKEQVLDGARMRTIAPFLSADTRIGMITNHDDIILGPGDLEALQSIFKDRAIVLDTGGHGGSIGRSDFVAATIALLGG